MSKKTKSKLNLGFVFLLIHFILAGVFNTLSAQTYRMSTNNGQTIATCSGNLYDSGGPSSNYGNNQNYAVTFDAGAGSLSKLTFISFNTEANFDFVYIYDGANTSSTLISTFSGNLTTPPSPITSSGRYITVRFTSDNATVKAGFNISISCVAGCSISANAGADISQCENGLFQMAGSALTGTQSGMWTKVSGTAYTNDDEYSPTCTWNVPSGSTATLRWTVTDGACSSSDDVVISNTTGCSTACTNPINVNGDLETEGSATNFNLTFQSTPALLLNNSLTPYGWGEGYGTSIPNSTNFTGAYYIKKTGVNSNPHSGTHMIYMAGPGFCYSSYRTFANVSCGKTYRVTAWVAAYTNGGAQVNTPFHMEGALTDWDNVTPTKTVAFGISAPASTSWNSLNWQRYSFDLTVDNNGYESLDLYFSTSDAVKGILIDDVCITEISAGSSANAGSDIYNCSNAFTMSANTPPSGYTGTWSVVSGSASITSINSPTTAVTITSGTFATLRWTVGNGSCSTKDDVVIGYSNSSLGVNNASICSGSSTTLTATGCTGNLSWSNGATTSSITVSPTSTTTYTVTCTPTQSSNLLLNPGFEAALPLDNWDVWQHMNITTVPSEVHSGSKAVKIWGQDTTWAGGSQVFDVTPGDFITLTFWAKATDVSYYGTVGIDMVSTDWTTSLSRNDVNVTSLAYAQYTATAIVPAGATHLQIRMETSQTNALFVDDLVVTKSNSCTSIAAGTVTVGNSNITLSNLNVGPCINQPLQDVSSVSVQVAWTSATSNKIEVKLGDKIEYIDVAGGATSPQTITFLVPADAASNTITANWDATSNVNPLLYADGFQLMTEGNVVFNNGSHVHGPLAVGGNMTLNGSPEIRMDAAGSYVFPGDAAVSGLIVKGGITWSSGVAKVLSNGLIHVGNSTGSASGDNGNNSMTRLYPSSSNYNSAIRIEGTVDQTPNPAVFQTVGYDFSGKFATMKLISKELAAKSNNVTLYNSSGTALSSNIVSSPTNVVISSLSSTEVNYLYLTTASLNNITELKFQGSGIPSSSKILVINVAITSDFTWTNVNMPGISGNEGKYIIWNFSGNISKNITINNNNLIIGTLFAPNHNLVKTGTGDIDGQLVFKSAILGLGELHYQSFQASLPTSVGSCDQAISFTAPTACSTNQISCDVLYLCGLDKPYDGDPWDHGMMNYISSVNSGYMLAALTKADATGLGLYDPLSQSTALNIDLNNYSLIIVSPTTEGHISQDLKYALQSFTGSVLNMNYDIEDDLSMVTGSGYYSFQNYAYTDATTQKAIYNYDNINPYYNMVLTGGDKKAVGTGFLWFGAGNASGNTNAIGYKYTAHSIPGVSKSHGNRVFLGYHMNGIYANSQNLGALPAPTSTYFSPTKHLTIDGKRILDQAIVDAAKCADEICGNGIDDDGDGLTDCQDPDCGFNTNYEFDEGTTGWELYNQNGGNSTVSIDNSSLISGRNSAKINITSVGTYNWSTQFVQNYKSLVAGKTYELSFSAKASSNRSINFGVDKGVSPWDETYFNQNANLTTSVQDFTYTFTATATRTNIVRVTFNLSTALGNVWLDNIQFKEACVTAEICGNGIDDDGDGLIDTADPDCPVIQTCTATGTNLFANPSFENGTFLGNDVFVTSVSSDYLATNWTAPSGLDGWTHGPLYWVQTTKATDGNKVVYINNTSGGAVCQGQYFDLGSGPGQLNSCSTYQLCFDWASFNRNNPNGRTVLSQPAIDLTWFDAANNQLSVSHQNLGNAVGNQNWANIKWSSVSYTFPLTGSFAPPAGATRVRVNLSESDTYPNGILFDNASLKVVSTTVPTVSITGNSTICVGGTTTLSPPTGGTWTSSNTSIATVTNAGVVTGVAAGTVTFTFTNSTTGCTSDKTNPITIIAKPTAAIAGTNAICAGSSSTFTASGGTTYVWSTGATTPAISVTTAGTYLVTVTNASGCSATASRVLTVTPALSATISHTGSVCLETGTQLTANPTGGTGTFTYLWAGPSSFTASTKTITVSINGTYSVTVTSGSCTYSTSFLLYQTYTPSITNLTGTVCEGTSIDLTVASATAVSYLWGSNAGNATTKDVTVFPVAPSTTYYVTVTNDLGCTAVPTITVTAKAKPTVAITGPSAICQGSTTTLSPTTGGTWTSGNQTIATVTNAGVVTGQSAGNVKFRFTNSTTGCASDSTVVLTVYPRPTPTFTGPTAICKLTTTQLSPTSGGTWASSNTSVATVTNAGLVTGVGAGTAYFTFTTTLGGCVSSASAILTVDDHVGITITGDNSMCIGEATTFTANQGGGTWSSSASSVATISNTGVVQALSAGNTTITYSHNSGSCSDESTYAVQVNPVPTVAVSGPASICAGLTTTLTPNTGGTWVSNNPTIASVNNSGLVTGISGGTATFTFTNSTTQCSSVAANASVTILSKPNISTSGVSEICQGSSTLFTPTSGGTWETSNSAVASITSGGLVSGISTGSVNIVFVSSSSNCPSDTVKDFRVNPKLLFTPDFNGSPCLTDASQLSATITSGTPTYTYSWTGPFGFNASTPSINVDTNGNYYVTVTDSKGCSANASAFVYERYEPFIVNLQTGVCEGNTVDLSVNTSSAATFHWSANAGNATTQDVTVTPVVPSSSYFVTVTNNLGCAVVANANINVNAKPTTNLTGPDGLCVGETSQIQPTTGGTWTSNNFAVASITNAGVITAKSAGTATFTFTNSTTQCASDSSEAITVFDNLPLSYNGPNSICIGGITYLKPSTGGTWTSNNPSIATITSSGTVTGVANGLATFSFTNSTGCASNGTLSVSVNDKPNIVLSGDPEICIGTTTQFQPSTGGTWKSSNPAIATITNTGLVTGVSAGTAKFIYTDNVMGCKSDSSQVITVNPRPTATLGGDNELCAGEQTTLNPTTGGLWFTSDGNIATINNSGVVMAIGAGTVTFTYKKLSTGCTSIPTLPITVNALPIVPTTGATICFGDSIQLSPTSGGSWISNNASIASISNNGMVHGLSAGSASFYFTNSTTGCKSNNTGLYTVTANPIANIDGPDSICIGSNTFLSPASGGLWLSSNPTVAAVNSMGMVTGLKVGQAVFTYVDYSGGCMSTPTLPVTIQDKPTISFTGANPICQGEYTQLTASTSGSWQSLNPTVAAVASNGLVTGISNGSAKFKFVSDLGCSSDNSLPLIVNGKPSIFVSGPSAICIGDSTTILPSTGGTWTSSKPAIATITNEGKIKGISVGYAKFIFTNSTTGCKSDSSGLIQINGAPAVQLLGNSSVCIGATTTLAPTSGGVWSSSNNAIATVNNSGIVTGVSPGTANFYFTDGITGCKSVQPIQITVNPTPVVSIDGDPTLCVGEHVNLISNTAGVWVANQPTIATVSVAGVVTGISQGLAKFTFTNTLTGCKAVTSNSVLVKNPPTLTLNGPSSLCIGNTTQFVSSEAGVWSSSNPSIASIDINGKVTANAVGSVTISFTATATGCTAQAADVISVGGSVVVSIDGPSEICMGFTTRLLPSTGGIWTSSNPKVATVNNSGIVTGHGPGKVSFTFTETATGCQGVLGGDPITVMNCLDPDFNVTNVNTSVSGNLATNDETPPSVIYGSIVYSNSKPSNSLPILSIQPDGSYTFEADKVGVYSYQVSACIPPYISMCETVNLVITVVDGLSTSAKNVPNTDIYTFAANSSNKIIKVLENDKCLATGGCALDPSSVTITGQPSHGSASVNSSGNIVFTPSTTHAGYDTITYRVCVDGNSSVCSTAKAIVVTNDASALNTVVAADDFAAGLVNNTIVTNILTNDSDPEGNQILFNAVGSASSPIHISQGDYYITAAGNLTFIPKNNFTGPLEITYTICDDNATQACASATLHLLVIGDITLRLRVYLEGSLMDNNNAMSQTGRPLMRDNLRVSPYDGKNNIPLKDPYTFDTEFTVPGPKCAPMGPGLLQGMTEISDSAAIFSVTGENAIVDWVYIELRSKNDYTHKIATRSALLQRDGDVVDLDGSSAIRFPGISVDSFYVVVRHRSHLGVMSQLVSHDHFVDFTNPNTPVFNFGINNPFLLDYTGLSQNTNVKNGYAALWAGDFNGDGKINFFGFPDDHNEIFTGVIFYPSNIWVNANYDLSWGYMPADFNMDGKCKYDNPDDEKNLLFFQILFYPLNTGIAPNFDAFVEQVPPASN